MHILFRGFAFFRARQSHKLRTVYVYRVRWFFHISIEDNNVNLLRKTDGQTRERRRQPIPCEWGELSERAGANEEMRWRKMGDGRKKGTGWRGGKTFDPNEDWLGACGPVLLASIRRHLKCVHVHTCAHKRTYAYNEMNVDRPLCSAFAKMAGISSPWLANSSAGNRQKAPNRVRYVCLGRNDCQQLTIIGRKSFYVFILTGPSVLRFSWGCLRSPRCAAAAHAPWNPPTRLPLQLSADYRKI